MFIHVYSIANTRFIGSLHIYGLRLRTYNRLRLPGVVGRNADKMVQVYVILLTFLGPEHKGRKMDVAHDSDMREVAGESEIARVVHPEWELNRETTVEEKANRAQRREVV